jgi:drug/metabolite transporter (DMT)-like permease
MNALDTMGRVLSVVGLLFVVVVFWQRERFKRFALARAGKPTFTRKQFWVSVAVGAVVFSLLPSFFQSCTGFHVAGGVVMSLGSLVVFTALLAFIYFVLERHRARHPETSVRLGFFFVAVAGVCFVVALFFYHLGHP